MRRFLFAVVIFLLGASYAQADILISTNKRAASSDTCASGNDAQTVLLIQSASVADGNTSFADTSNAGGHTLDITVNGDTHHETDYAFPGFGTSSIYFDGTGDSISLTDDADWDLGAGDFCVELKWNFGGAVDNDSGLIGRYANEANTWGLQFSVDKLYWYYAGGTAYSFLWSPAINTAYHIAVTRISGTLRAFINGTQIGANQADATNYNTAAALRIGDYVAAGGSPATGYAQEIAIHKGDGVYAAGGFTPNTMPYCN